MECATRYPHSINGSNLHETLSDAREIAQRRVDLMEKTSGILPGEFWLEWAAAVNQRGQVVPLIGNPPVPLPSHRGDLR